MSIRTRIALIVLMLTLGLVVVAYGIQRTVVYGQFLDLERRGATDDLGRCTDAVDREIEHLQLTCADWANADGACAYVADPKPEWFAANIQPAPMKSLRWNALVLVAADGRVVNSFGRDFRTNTPISFPEFSADRFSEDHALVPHKSDADFASGILRTGHGLLLVSSRRLLASGQKRPPSGWIITGRLLTDELLATLVHQTRVAFRMLSLADPAIDSATRTALAAAPSDGAPTISEASDELLYVYKTVQGVDGRPVAVIRAEIPRDIALQVRASMQIAAGAMLAAGLSTVLAIVVALGVSVVTPMRRLTAYAESIGRGADLFTRSGVTRTDEIGVLATTLDVMAERLAESRAQVTQAAHLAGMADIARSVLHNVGNVLTGVNVSARTITETLRRSRAEGLCKAADLVAENRTDLARFLTADDRGRMLPEYLARAASAAREERAALVAEAQRIERGVDHAASIVRRQNEFASAAPVAEETTLDAAATFALSLVEQAFARHSIQVERSIEERVRVVIDRIKLSQVLVNLLTNAKEALTTREPEARRIVVRAAAHGDRVRIEVADNGSGIAPDLVASLFESGFSTKGTGRGLGLHFAALSAREMGGSVTVTSEGLDRGATFTLDLPQGVPAGTNRPARPDVAVMEVSR